MPKILAPYGITSVSFNGKEYKVSRAGTVTVPSAALVDLLDHGFVLEDKADQLKPVDTDVDGGADSAPPADQLKPVDTGADEGTDTAPPADPSETGDSGAANPTDTPADQPPPVA